MSKDPLDTAIDLVKMGKQAEAMPILTMLIRNNPHDEKAWVWLIQAVPQNQRRQAAEMFFKENPDNELAKKALQVVGRQISHESDAVPVVPPIPIGEKLEPSVPFASEAETPVKNDDPLASIFRKEGNILPELPPDSNYITGAIPLTRRRKNKLTPVILLGVTAVFILVLVVMFTHKGWFSGLSLPGRVPTKLPNIETQFAAVQQQTPLITTTPVQIMSSTPDINSTPTAGLATLSTPLATPPGAPIINPDNALNLILFSRVQAPQKNVLISPRLSFIFPLTASSEIRLLDFNTHEILFRAYLPSDSLALAAFSPDESYLAAAVNHGDIIIYDIRAGKSIRTIRTGSLVLENTGSMAFSGDGHTLAVISGGQYGVWNVDSGELLGTGNSLYVAMAVSSKMLFLGCAGFVCAEDITTGKQVSRFDVNDTSSLFTVSIDGERIAIRTHSSDNLASVGIYSTADGAQQVVIKTPLSVIWGLAFSPDGRTLAAWGENSANGQYALALLDVEKGVNINAIDLGPYQDKAGMIPIKLTFTPDGISIVAITSVEVMIFAVQ